MICWPQNCEWPCNLAEASTKRIRLKHFQYRDIKQIISRLQARNAADSGSSFTHEKVSVADWYKKRNFTQPDDISLAQLRIVDSRELNSDDKYSFVDSELPPIIKYNLKRKVKKWLVDFYMRYLNTLLFKL